MSSPRSLLWAIVLTVACGTAEPEVGPSDGFVLADVADVAAAASWPGLPTDVPTTLGAYGFFEADALASERPVPGVIAYDVNAPLWSDRAVKHRFIALPPGGAMVFDPDGVFDLPVGAVLIKSFGFPLSFDDPASPVRLVETRLLVHEAAGWRPQIYLWNAEQTEATRLVPGRIIPVEYELGGVKESHSYVVPNSNQCKDCHAKEKTVGPIGITARQLDREVGNTSQLNALEAAGALTGVSGTWTPLEDPYGDGALDARARAWLDANCGHCHRPGGEGGPSGLVLEANATASDLGACKTPVAAGPASGDAQYDIFPGEPDASILVKRITTLDPGNKMPELPNLLPDEAGIALIRAWILAMDGAGCDATGLPTEGQ